MKLNSIKAKVMALSIMAVSLTAVILIGVILYEKGAVQSQSTQMQGEVGELLTDLARSETGKVSRDVYLMCRAMQETLNDKVHYDLNVARDVLSRTGKVRFSRETAEWNAVNQFSKSSTRIELPKMMVGDTWLGQNKSMSTVSPLVDDVKRMVGGTCTIFQRMNDAGDMLRVCTNVLKTDGSRAIGTYIPATNPDGKPNGVISAVLKGETFTGRAFVVDAWYITAYEPIRDADGRIVGVLYTGVKQESAQSLRKGIMDIVVGKTGYVYILGGSGDIRGHYIISYKGQRDGENIWEARDAEGNYFIQDIVNLAKKTSDGSVDYIRYPWQNKGESEARFKMAAVTYFESWDWVIGAGAYESDFQEVQAKIDDSVNGVMSAINTMVVFTLTIAAILIAAFSLISAYVASKIAGRLNRAVDALTQGSEQVAAAANQISESSQGLAEGASEQASSVEESSSALEELASQAKNNSEKTDQAAKQADQAQAEAHQASEAMAQTVEVMGEIKESSDKISGIIKSIEEIAFQTNLLALNAAVEAARAGDHGKGFAVVAEEVRNLAQRAATSAKDTAELIERSVNQSNKGAEVVDKAAVGIKKILEVVKSVTAISREVNAASDEQATGVEQINKAVGQMDSITQQLASNAEESASASEELSAQARQLDAVVADIVKVVSGKTVQDNRVAESQVRRTSWAEKPQPAVKRLQSQTIRSLSPKEQAEEPEPVTAGGYTPRGKEEDLEF